MKSNAKSWWAGARKTARTNPTGKLLRLEALEERTLLSVSPGVISVANPLGNASQGDQTFPPNDDAFSPQELVAAYSDDDIYFGTAAGTGAGQTIAIVDAYNNPDIAGDLTHFDAAFGLPAPPSFSVVGQTGTTSLPETDPAALLGSDGWENEEALDVEYAHAIAPGANIVVVEANSGDKSDLYAAAVEAGNLGSVVSMSWGTAEFSGEQAYDVDFTVPGVTYLAASGDDGSPGIYPASSPNVIAVGGTELKINSSGGSPPYSYASETGWSGSGGGTSMYEPEPTYQDGVQSTDNRTIPDVSANAAFGNGAWVYNSYNYTSSGGAWFDDAGTSLATPMWAGLIAIADQGRAAAGEPTLSGASDTLQALYNLEANSPQDFHDITSGSNGAFSAGLGYDEVTGLGSPVANMLIPGLVGDGTAAAATQLAVTAQPPGNFATGSTFGLTVAAEDASGTMDPNYNGPVTIGLSNNPGGAMLGGTDTVNAVDGLATFTNLTLSQAGDGYTLQATATGLTTATTRSLNVLALPVVEGSGTLNTFRLGGTPVAVDAGTMVTSVDGNISGTTMTISASTLKTGDMLNFTNQNGISGSYSGGMLTLSGNATAAQYQTALQSVTFSTASTSTVARTVAITAFDGTLDSDTVHQSVKVVVAAPTVTPSGSTGTFTLGGSQEFVDTGVTLSSADADLSGATVTITNYQSGDAFHFLNQNGISGRYSGGVLTLSGSATVADYQTALQTVRFSTTSTNTTTRSLSIAAIDGSAIGGAVNSNPAAESINVTIPAPVVTPSGATGTFTLGGSQEFVDPGITVSSLDTDLTGATVTISAGTLQSGDAFHFLNQNGISGHYSGGVLTLSGSATLADYQTALQTVRFSTTSTDTTTRSVSIVVDDSSASPTTSNPAAESINVTIPAPVVIPSGTVNTYVVGDSAVVVDPGVTVSSFDTNLTGATVTISNYQPGDVLHFRAQNNIIVDSNVDGVLTLSTSTFVGGGATPAEYQAALQSITFLTTSTTTTTRLLSIVVDDSSASPTTSNSVAESVNVALPPVVTPSGTVNTYTIGGSAVVVDPGLTVSSSDTDLTGVTLAITAGATGDTLYFTNQNGISGSFSGAVLTLSGSATVGQYQAALDSITFATNRKNLITRSISIVAIDGSVESSPAIESVMMLMLAPVVTANQASVNATAGQTVTVDSALAVSSFDTNVTGAAVTIGSGFSSGDSLNFTSQNGISGSYADGVLTLTGLASPAQYQAALQSVTFSSTSTSTAARNISVVVSDANDTGNVGSNTATIEIVASAPATITGIYVSGAAWTSAFNNYLAASNLGSATNPSLGYALQTGSAQLTPLPFANIDTIDVQFSQAVSGVTAGSLELIGGIGTGSAPTPAVTGVTPLANNVYQFDLSGPLGNNHYLIAVASTGSSFGPAVVDANGAGISGTFTTTASSFPSGNGLAGSTFDFFFSVLPGDGNQNGLVNASDTAAVRAECSFRTTTTGYNPYLDFNGAGVINATDVAIDNKNASARQTTITSPMAPSDEPVGGLSTGFTVLALGVQENASSTPLVAGNSSSASQLSYPSNASADGAGPSSAGLSIIVTSTPSGGDFDDTQFVATGEALLDFDLADLWV